MGSIKDVEDAKGVGLLQLQQVQGTTGVFSSFRHLKTDGYLNHLKITIFALNSCFSSSFSTILSRGCVTQLQSKIVIIIITVVIIEKQEWTRHLLKHIPFQEHFYSII